MTDLHIWSIFWIIFLLIQLSKAHFKILLEYLEDLKGASRKQTLKEAKEFVEANEDTESMFEKCDLYKSCPIRTWESWKSLDIILPYTLKEENFFCKNKNKIFNF